MSPGSSANPQGVNLVASLGASWLVIPEVLAFIDPARFSLFPENWWGLPGHGSGPRARIERVDVVTTLGAVAVKAHRDLATYLAALPDPPILRSYAVAEMEDVRTLEDHEQMAEAVYRVCLAASTRPFHLFVSLAGGRKTMSALLQQAASIFGARETFHVLAAPEAESSTRNLDPGEAARSGLPEAAAAGIHPLALGGHEPFDGLAWQTPDSGPVRLEDYPLVERVSDGITVLPRQPPILMREITSRLERAQSLSANYFFHLLKAGRNQGFLSLYRLSPARLEALRRERIGASEANATCDREWLRKLPKADLHCHLGGVATHDELPQLAEATLGDCAEYASLLDEATRTLSRSPERATAESLHADLKERGHPVHVATALVILAAHGVPGLLYRLTALGDGKNARGVGIRAYMKAGWLQGSALLQNRAGIHAACRLLLRKAKADNLRYLEVRCSPANYTQGGLTPEQALGAIASGLQAGEAMGVKVSIILIGTRHRSALFESHVQLALTDRAKDGPSVVGFDIAGDESAASPKKLRPLVERLQERCIKLTIHAGETAPVEGIWQAVYLLGADRIGHGLNLADKPELLALFRDRGTAVELCPTSNDQVVGFDKAGTYPLRKYLEEGVRVTVCTDNPGISRTDWTNELYQAARMTPGGLSKWDILVLTRNALQASFLPRPERQRLVRTVDQEVYEVLSTEA